MVIHGLRLEHRLLENTSSNADLFVLIWDLPVIPVGIMICNIALFTWIRKLPFVVMYIYIYILTESQTIAILVMENN